MCVECGNTEHKQGEIFTKGIITGLNHLDYTDSYYPGLNQYQVEFDPLKKHVAISPTGFDKTKYGEW